MKCADCNKRIIRAESVLIVPSNLEIQLGISTMRTVCGKCAHKAIVKA